MHQHLSTISLADRASVAQGPTVRARALLCLATLLTSEARTYLRTPLAKLVFITAPDTQTLARAASAGAINTPATLSADSETPVARISPTAMEPLTSPLLSPAGVDVGSGKVDLLALLRRRAHDERPNVRKAALQVLQSIGELVGEVCLLTVADMQIYMDASIDVAVGIRKQALMSLTHLLQAHPTEVVIQVRLVLWLLFILSCSSFLF
jgi:hypothetical protein